ncbi:hypothetical protein ABL78_6051 [Leptomonas seymouri]|uniref:ATP-grasp domain-containing protein n=1 Tax=Leptomonas seymouri TaxID=5684 RepID=A0A0N0P453_LEPSE|nr:hypothetical protein ABL78_6051 [Leptomonas seymouri]|eukprot:KPI84896.1 hypothetical protein ABL78_6051 [Leptomonas seymouri]
MPSSMGNRSSKSRSNTPSVVTAPSTSASAAEQGKTEPHNSASRVAIMATTTTTTTTVAKAPFPPVMHPVNGNGNEPATWLLELGKATLIETLVTQYHCSSDCATSTVESFFPDVEKCHAMVQAKINASFVQVVGLVTKQREYVDMLCADLHSAFANFPLFNGSMKSDDDGDVPAEAAAGLPPIDWAAVRTGLFAGDKAPLLYQHAELVNIGLPTDLLVLENAYKSLVEKKGFAHLIGCYASGDGVVGAMDYVNERLRGTSMQELARQMHFEPEAVGAVNGGEAQTSTPVHTRVNAFGNNPVTSHSKRQNKGSSQEALRDAGLAYIRSVVTTSSEEAIEKIRDGTVLLPVVVKPSTGAGSEFVTLCYTEKDVRVAFEMVEGMQTSQGTDAAVLVMEEYIEGPEYVVNTVSYNGVAVVTDLWRSWKYPKAVYTTGMSHIAEQNLSANSLNERKRNKTSILYDKQTLFEDLGSLPPDHEARRVAEYTLKCLDALELRNGCAHCELRVDMRDAALRRRRNERKAISEPVTATTSSAMRSGIRDAQGEPVLIELNPRMQGDAPRSTDIVGYDQFSLMVYIGEAVNTFGGATAVSTQLPFRGPSYSPSCGDIPWPPVPRLYRALKPYSPCTTVLFLVASADCILNGTALPHLTALKSFERFTRTIFKPNLAGYVTPLRQTVDLFSSPSACIMRGPPEQVEADCKAIRAMEAADVAPATASMLQDAVAKTESMRLMRSALLNAERHLQYLKESHENRRSSRLTLSGGAEEAAAEAVHAQGRQLFLAEAQEYRDTLVANVAEVKEHLDELRAAITTELLNQSPPPLYIGYEIFNQLKHSNLGFLLSVP